MVTKITTECDRCGAACEYGVTRFSATTEHWTSQRETAGEDYYKQAELCVTCGEVVAQMIGMAKQHTEKYARDERAIEAPHVEIRPQPEVRAWTPVGIVDENQQPGMLVMGENNRRSHP